MALSPLQFSGRSLTPDALGAVQQGQQISQGQNVLGQQRFDMQQQQQAAKEKAEQEATGRDLLGRTTSGEKGPEIGAEKAKLFYDNPELGKRLRAAAGLDTEQKSYEMALFGKQLGDLAGNRPAQQAAIKERAASLESQGRNASDTRAMLTASDDDLARQAWGAQIQGLNRKELAEVIMKGQDGGKQGMASAKTEIMADGTVIQALPNNTVEVRNPLGNLVEGAARTAALKASQQFREQELRTKSEIAIQEAEGKANATQRATRISNMRTEQTTRSTQASRAEVKIREALTLVTKATQGSIADVKLLAAKVIPGIDVSNEAALSAAMTSLAVDQLQRMKGPSTDFEFGKMEQISGSISDPKEANIAKLKVAQRAAWFTKREAQQFNKFIADNGDPDLYSFNINETIKTKRGPISLMDIQETAAFNNISIEDALKRFNQ